MNALLARIGHSLLRWGWRLPSDQFLSRFYQKQRLLELLHRLQINCVVDVGANKGLYANSLRKLGYRGAILCFEPVAEDFAEIVRISSGDDTWRAFNCALGNDDTSADFNVIKSGNATFLSSLLESNLRLGDRIEKRAVAVKRLDSVLGESGLDTTKLRIFLKTDTQGYDLEVIKGCGSILPKVHGIQCEVSVIPLYEKMPHYTQALEFLERQGFSLVDLDIVNRDRNGCVVEYDCVMIRVSGTERNVE
jgi:FkbM family methyltransferase